MIRTETIYNEHQMSIMKKHCWNCVNYWTTKVQQCVQEIIVY